MWSLRIHNHAPISTVTLLFVTDVTTTVLHPFRGYRLGRRLRSIAALSAALFKTALRGFVNPTYLTWPTQKSEYSSASPFKKRTQFQSQQLKQRTWTTVASTTSMRAALTSTTQMQRVTNMFALHLEAQHSVPIQRTRNTTQQNPEKLLLPGELLTDN